MDGWYQNDTPLDKCITENYDCVEVKNELSEKVFEIFLTV